MSINNLFKSGIKNIFYTSTSQIISFILSVIISLILPNAMGIVDFGYWQVYLFYVGLILILSFGYNDGIYLRYGNYEYSNLPFKKIGKSIQIYIFISLIFVIILFFISSYEKDINKTYAFYAVSINLLIMSFYGSIITILQITNRLREYSILVIINKVSFATLTIILFLADLTKYKFIIFADIISKIIIIVIGIYYTKELFPFSLKNLKIGIIEYLKNIKVGIHLLVSNIIGILIFSFGRVIIERYLSIEQYSNYSFAATITFFALAFINASSLSLYPLLKRLPNNTLDIFFKNITNIFSIAFPFILLMYYPLFFFVSHYFILYSDILEYFAFFIIIIALEGKMQFIYNSFFKALRKEKQLLYINSISFFFAIALIYPLFIYISSVKSIIIGTTVSYFIRCYVSELLLYKHFNLKIYKSFFIELSALTVFIISTYFSLSIGILIYTFIITLICVYNVKYNYTTISKTYKFLRNAYK